MKGRAQPEAGQFPGLHCVSRNFNFVLRDHTSIHQAASVDDNVFEISHPVCSVGDRRWPLPRVACNRRTETNWFSMTSPECIRVRARRRTRAPSRRAPRRSMRKGFYFIREGGSFKSSHLLSRQSPKRGDRPATGCPVQAKIKVYLDATPGASRNWRCLWYPEPVRPFVGQRRRSACC